MSHALACTIPASLAVRYREHRVRAGSTVADVARAAGCSVQLIEAVEAGTATLEQATVVLLNEALGVSRDAIIHALLEHAAAESPERRRSYQLYTLAFVESTRGFEGTVAFQGETQFRAWCTEYGHDPNDVQFQSIVADLRGDDEREGRSVCFYRPDRPHGCYSNYSRHSVVIDGLTFTTSEHYYQWAKHVTVDPAYAERIRLAPTPGKCWRLANDRTHPQRPDWDRIKDDVMRLVVLLKFTQHEECRRELLSTGDLMLIEASPRDWYWGEGADRTGRNMLGIVLMEVRDAIRNNTTESYERDVRSRLMLEGLRTEIAPLLGRTELSHDELTRLGSLLADVKGIDTPEAHALRDAARARFQAESRRHDEYPQRRYDELAARHRAGEQLSDAELREWETVGRFLREEH